MEQRAVNPRARWRANHQRTSGVATVTVAQRCRIVDDLIEGARDKIRELHFDHRTHPEHCGANSRADDQRLRDRRVDHALLAERVEQPFGGLERAAQIRHVLAHDEDIFVAAHLLGQRAINRLEASDFHCLSARRWTKSSARWGKSERPAARKYLQVLLEVLAADWFRRNPPPPAPSASPVRQSARERA